MSYVLKFQYSNAYLTLAYLLNLHIPLLTPPAVPSPQHSRVEVRSTDKKHRLKLIGVNCHHVTISASLQLTSGNICVFYYGGNWMVHSAVCVIIHGNL